MVSKKSSGNTTVKNLVCFCISAQLLSACALSPQVVVIDPVVSPGATASARGNSILDIKVRDTRRSNVIGQRGGVYEATSHISTDGNMVITLQNRIAQAFEKLGYNINPGSGNTTAALTVDIVDISYITAVDKLVRTVEVKSSIQAICRKNGQEYTSSYRVTNKKEVLKVPTEEENEKLVNDAVAVVLERLLSDKDLFVFIDS
jgi:uncharacterized lipoprotein